MNGTHHSMVERAGRASTEAKSVMCVGAASGLMVLFSLFSMAHLTVRYSSSETSTVPNFPDHLKQAPHLRSSSDNVNATTESLVTADNLALSQQIKVKIPSDADLVSIQFDTLDPTKKQFENPAEENFASSLNSGGCFDMYLFTMSYEPEFCYEHYTSDFPACIKPNMNYSTHLVIHGLWPECSTGSYPQNCRPQDAALDPQVIRDLAPEFTKLWPDAKNPDPDPTKGMDFYAHEWSKHGTCTSLTQHQYFEAAFDTYIEPTPYNLIEDNYGKEIDTEILRTAFERLDPQQFNDSRSSVILICRSKYLQEVRICMAKTDSDFPTMQIPCPEPVWNGMINSMCNSKSVTLTKFRENSSLPKENTSLPNSSFLPIDQDSTYFSSTQINQEPELLALLSPSRDDTKKFVKDYTKTYLPPIVADHYSSKPRSHNFTKTNVGASAPATYLTPIVDQYDSKSVIHNQTDTADYESLVVLDYYEDITYPGSQDYDSKDEFYTSFRPHLPSAEKIQPTEADDESPPIAAATGSLLGVEDTIWQPPSHQVIENGGDAM